MKQQLGQDCLQTLLEYEDEALYRMVEQLVDSYLFFLYRLNCCVISITDTDVLLPRLLPYANEHNVFRQGKFLRFQQYKNISEPYNHRFHWQFRQRIKY